MKRLTYIEIVGKIYPMSFSLMATKKIAQKYGSVKDFLKNINTEGSEEKTISVISEVLELLISQGCAYKNYFEKDVPAPDNAPIIDGKWTPLPKEALEIALGISDLAIAADKIAECMNEGETKEVEGKENKSKNVEAGQE